MDRGAWQATVYGVTESWSQLSHRVPTHAYTTKCLASNSMPSSQQVLNKYTNKFMDEWSLFFTRCIIGHTTSPWNRKNCPLQALYCPDWLYRPDIRPSHLTPPSLAFLTGKREHPPGCPGRCWSLWPQYLWMWPLFFSLFFYVKG